MEPKLSISIDLRGFTFTEVLVAVCILGVAIVPMFGLFTGGSRNAAMVAGHTRAVSIASESLEIVSCLPYRELASGGDLGRFSPPPPDEVYGPGFSREIYVEDSGIPGLMLVGARVRWKEKGADRVVFLETLVGDHGI